ncbi:hypothetical protein Tco_1069388 [Tanacetum coccineum]|uniref:Uncharacterized protein n=1 Tax=Tanacetum coccineum TaxID=301880 RepID=A0ABQ5HJT5_9ASTR
MEWLPKCAELEMVVGSQKWLDMMVLYYRRVTFVHELESLSGVIATTKTADFFNETMIKDDGRIMQLHNLKRAAEERAI